PDGSQVAFSRWTDAQQGWNVFVSSVEAGGLLQLTGAGSDDRRPTWSPDGRWIAYLAHENGTCDVRVISPLGGASRAVAACHPDEVNALAWTHDGQALIFRPPGMRGLGRVALRDGHSITLTDPPADTTADADPAVSPDGRML